MSDLFGLVTVDDVDVIDDALTVEEDNIIADLLDLEQA